MVAYNRPNEVDLLASFTNITSRSSNPTRSNSSENRFALNPMYAHTFSYFSIQLPSFVSLPSPNADLVNASLHQIHILLPPLATVRTVTEHLAKLSPHLTISANMGGTLTFKAGQNEAKGVEVETEWGGLKVPSVGEWSWSMFLRFRRIRGAAGLS